MKNRKSEDLKTDPWETPAITGTISECSPYSATACVMCWTEMSRSI